MEKKYNDVERILAEELCVGDYFIYNETIYKCINKHNNDYITEQTVDGSEEDTEYYYISLPMQREVRVAKRERRWLVQEFDEDKDLISEELFIEKEDAYTYILSFVRFMGTTHRQEGKMNMDLAQLAEEYDDDTSFMETNTYGHYMHYMRMSELITHEQSIEYN